MTGLVTETLNTAIAAAIGSESRNVAALRAYNEQARENDPSKIAWPATLVLELALKTAPPCQLRESYGYTDEEWDALRYNPVFIRELSEACEQVKTDGYSFRAKAKFQAEALLETQWKMIHAPGSEVPAAVKQKMMESVFRMAGFDNKDGAVGGGNMLAIQINLG